MRAIGKAVLSFLVAGAICQTAFSQGAGRPAADVLVVKVKSADGPVAGALVSVRGTEVSAVTDQNGQASISGLSSGGYVLEIVANGYRIAEIEIDWPRPSAEPIIAEIEENESEVVISTTRTGREIENTPTRVEAIDEEEIDEKSSMRSSNVSMLLNESTGIKVQQTSATTFTQSIRIQGLDGRYTQLLKDGFPAFGGFSGNLSVLDIQPLDLKQVEIIKGASSTFYGGGAIAGVINFISKEPGNAPHTSLILNQTSALGSDLSAFHTRRHGRFGTTLFGAFSFQNPYDADGDEFTELPLTASFTVNPRLFVYGKGSRLMLGNSTSYQFRDGGQIDAVRGRDSAQYLESHRSIRNITTIQFDKDLDDGGKFYLKQAVAFFRRTSEIPGYRFGGSQVNSFTEVSIFKPHGKHLLVFGANAIFDEFSEDGLAPNPRDESRQTVGGFVQGTFDLGKRVSIEAGARVDGVNNYGVFVLPRISLLYHLSERISGRVTFGFGYKTPTIFTEEAETVLFRNIFPVGGSLRAETSRGSTIDINYRDSVGEKFTVSINQMFFYTEIRNPLVLGSAQGTLRFENSAEHIRTTGFETNLRLSYDIVKLFAGYTFTDAVAGYLPGDRHLALTPKSKLNSALLFEKEDSFKAGIEAYFTGRQLLANRTPTRRFWVVGLFAERVFGKFSLFFNAENLTDTRQSRFGQVVFPPFENPTFAEIYTHTEGRIFNGGVKIRF